MYRFDGHLVFQPSFATARTPSKHRSICCVTSPRPPTHPSPLYSLQPLINKTLVTSRRDAPHSWAPTHNFTVLPIIKPRNHQQPVRLHTVASSSIIDSVSKKIINPKSWCMMSFYKVDHFTSIDTTLRRF